ncbi:peptidoglycan recognition protein family protein [Streptomyces xiamenensis]
MPESPTSPTPPASHRPASRVTRRALIGTAGAVAAGAVVTPAVIAATGGSGDGDGDGAGKAGDAAPAGTTPQSFPKTRSAAATGEEAVRTAFPIGFVGVAWAGARHATGGGIRFTGADGDEAGATWTPLSGGGCSDSNGGRLLVAARQATGYELRAPQGATDLVSVALDTARGPRHEIPVPTDPTRVRGVEYLSRAAWGADESLRFLPDGSENTPTAFYAFQTLTVHHTVTPNDDPDPAATVRGIYEFHAITNDWGDIGYHFLIDEEGRIYEGRYSGEGGLPAHNEDGDLVTAFHVGGFNSGNLGIALLGDLTERPPTDAARASLTRLVRTAFRLHGRDPLADVTYVNPVNGVEKDVAEISGHRDWLETDCPGEVMYAELAELREAVASQR